MPYITIQQSPVYYQISLFDILDGEKDVSKMFTQNLTNTRTHYTRYLQQKFLDRFDFDAMIETLIQFNEKNARLFEVDRKSLYDTFHIPKKSGGLREINAPVPELMTALRDLKTIFEVNMFALYHTSAFAYVKGRSTIDSIKRHQQNESKWFEKLDFSNFFGSTTEDFVMSMFSMIFPFNEIVKRTDGREALRKALSLCFLNGGLPQGTPISPTITNIMMIPVDHQISNELREFQMPVVETYYENGIKQKRIIGEEKQRFVYTRYADDILISSKTDFDPTRIQNYIVDVLKKFNAPFTIKNEKTRYGSSAGRNWNLGVMLNKDNEITIGHQKKKAFKAMCCNYICDKRNGVDWDIHDVQTFRGLISYYKMVEPDYIDYVIQHNNQKFSVNLLALIKADLS